MSAVTDFYEMAMSAAKTRAQIREAVSRGDAARYHALFRSNPEAKLAEPLRVVRRSLSMLAEERHRLPDSLPPALRQIQEDQITAAMEQVAAGTLMWANEVLGKPSPMQPTPPSPQEGGVPSPVNTK